MKTNKELNDIAKELFILEQKISGQSLDKIDSSISNRIENILNHLSFSEFLIVNDIVLKKFEEKI